MNDTALPPFSLLRLASMIDLGVFFAARSAGNCLRVETWPFLDWVCAVRHPVTPAGNRGALGKTATERSLSMNVQSIHDRLQRPFLSPLVAHDFEAIDPWIS